MNIVIVGGGFAGVKAARELSKRRIGRITLISNESFFLHHATLYATATGKNASASVIPLRSIFEDHPRVNIVKDEITSLDASKKTVKGKRGTYPYDVLIMAIGSVTNYFNIKGLRQYAYGISTYDDIKEFTEHINKQITKDNMDKRYFVIGAGPSGVELAGALQEHIKSLIKLYRLGKQSTAVALVEAAPRVLPALSKTASKIVLRRLRKLKVLVLKNKRVEGLNKNAVIIDGTEHDTKTVIWTSGAANNPFFKKHGSIFKLTANGRVVVDQYLRAQKDIFVLGDNNNVKYSGMAWPAMQQATYVAKYLAKKRTMQTPRPFKPKSVPTGIPVGSKWGYVEWKGVYAAGKLGHLIRRLMELYGYAQLVPLKKAVPIWRSLNIPQVEID